MILYINNFSKKLFVIFLFCDCLRKYKTLIPLFSKTFCAINKQRYTFVPMLSNYISIADMKFSTLLFFFTFKQGFLFRIHHFKMIKIIYSVNESKH